MRQWSLLVISALYSLQVSATMFVTQTLKDQIQYSDGILVGNFLKSDSVELEDGLIATKMHFKVEKEFGLQTNIFKTDEVIVHYPGGTIGDKKVTVDGVPEFMIGTPVVLMIKNVNNRFWGMNLALGSFHIVKYGDDKLIVNKIFPHTPGLGQTQFSEFEKLVRAVKGENLKMVYSDIEENPTQISRGIASVPEKEVGNFRKVASTPEIVENEGESTAGKVWWLVGTLAFLGMVSVLRRRHS